MNPIVETVTHNRRLFVTEKGYLGIAPATTELGGAVCVLFGSQMPMDLRQEDDHWLFVGQTYIHGIMDGEALEGVDVEKTRFILRSPKHLRMAGPPPGNHSPFDGSFLEDDEDREARDETGPDIFKP